MHILSQNMSILADKPSKFMVQIILHRDVVKLISQMCFR